MRSRRAKTIWAVAVATLCIAAVPASAEDPKAAMRGAHDTIRDVINRGVVKGNVEKTLNVVGYRGSRCQSNFEYLNSVEREIDWSVVTSVADIPGFTHVYGRVVRTSVHGLTVTESDARFWLTDDDAAKALGYAMKVLVDSCAPKPKEK